MNMTTRPGASDAAEYYFTYIDQVPDGDIREILERQSADTLALLRAIPDELSRLRYADDKWSIRQVVSHLNDCERLFVFRAFWFARGFDAPLPSFDQNVAMAAAGADERSWKSHIDEFSDVRASTIAFFRNLPDESWTSRGTASGYAFSARGLAYIAAGHVAHHVRILNERYLAGLQRS